MILKFCEVLNKFVIKYHNWETIRNISPHPFGVECSRWWRVNLWIIANICNLPNWLSAREHHESDDRNAENEIRAKTKYAIIINTEQGPLAGYCAVCCVCMMYVFEISALFCSMRSDIGRHIYIFYVSDVSIRSCGMYAQRAWYVLDRALPAFRITCVDTVCQPV